MKTTIVKTLLQFFLPVVLSSSYVSAQNDTPTCYAPLAGGGQVAIPVNNTTVCVNLQGPCGMVSNPGNVVDADLTNFAEYTSSANLNQGDGITVQDNTNTYPAGYFAGYVVDLGGPTFLRAELLSSFTVSTFNNGAFREASTTGTLGVVTAIGTSPGKVYLNFKTSLSFDEVRLTFNASLTVLPSFKIYYATAFDANCGFSEDNGRCGDQIGGANSSVTFNGGPLGILTSITNPGNITDGNKNSFATITIPIGTGVLGADPYVGVLNEQQIYAPNTTVGFVVSRPSILTLDVLNNVRLQTYLFGVLQDDRSISNGIAVTAFTGADDRTSISMVTTKQYNEVRLVLSGTAINIGTLRVYYAFEQPTTCSTCIENVVTGTAPFTPMISPPSRTGELGVACISIGDPLPDLSNEPNVVNADVNDFASYTFGTGAGIGCGFQLSVQLGTTVAANTVTGFVISRPFSLLNANILGNTVINTYLGGNLVNSSTTANLLGLTVLSSGNGDKDSIAFRATAAFDEVQIVITTGLISLNLGSNREIRVYNAFVIRDTDNDGTPNCLDQCPNGNDAIDTDSDGIPDCFAVILPLTLTGFDARAVSNKQVLLTWQTMNEVNTKQFTIERSGKPLASNSPDWQTIGTLSAAGTVSGSRSYQLTDNQPLSGANYYRIRTTDKDGKQLISEIKLINFKGNSLLLSAVYPNPVERGGAITIAVAETIRYRLLDKTGRLVNTGTFATGTAKLKAPTVAGTYLLEIMGAQNEGKTEHHRIIVQ